MAATTTSIANTSSKPVSDVGLIPTPVKTPKRKISLSSPTGPQSFPKPPHSPSRTTKDYRSVFENWPNYSMNTNVTANYTNQNPMLSPPSTMSTTSPRSSTTSSPAEPAIHYSDYSSPLHLKTNRVRSKSFAIPTPTSCCPNCGLRRPSSISDRTLTPTARSLSASKSPYHRPHLPLHLHCPDFCPDEHFPTKNAMSPTTPQITHRHHRRRSSLCYAESLVEDAEHMDTGGVPLEVRQDWEKQAQNIARKVVMRKAGLGDVRAVEEAVMED